MQDSAFARYDETDDARFYVQPRLVEHIDAGAIAAVVELHREILPAGGVILDCMSSWVSHLPPDVTYESVTGLGMNATELAANPRLDRYVVHDLNRTPTLPFADDTFDGIEICVSIQYLQNPVAVLADLARVAKVGAPIVISFSNRCFPTKAVAIWQQLSNVEHGKLVRSYLEATERWESIAVVDRSARVPGGPPRRDPLHAVIARVAPTF
jgi:SAM-dependent methyltransferase